MEPPPLLLELEESVSELELEPELELELELECDVVEPERLVVAAEDVVVAELLLLAVELLSSLFSRKNRPTPMPARTMTPATTRATIVPFLLLGGWP